MSSFVDMSLEDIIKKNRKGNPRTKKIINPNVNNPRKKQNQPQNLQVTDARNKIISKKRTQITDAREKLAELAKQKDARLKLEKLRLERAKALGRKGFPNQNKHIRTAPNKDRIFTDVSRQVVSKPLSSSKFTARRHINNNPNKFMGTRSIERVKPAEKFTNLKPIFRTVENDLEIIDDPMEDEVPPKSVLMNRKASLQLKIVTHNNDLRDKRVATVHRTTSREKEQSPPRLPSILKKRPMAALRSDDRAERAESNEKPHLEYRIIVSNLRNTVTGGDIQELFGDVGGMLESRLVRPGTAEVIYKTQEDAQKAVDLYHNRQLDGQPMNCLLVTPRAPSSSSRSSSKPALYSTNSNVEPDISTFHKVLFSNL